MVAFKFGLGMQPSDVIGGERHPIWCGRRETNFPFT
jgi:hypothetical protein